MQEHTDQHAALGGESMSQDELDLLISRNVGGTATRAEWVLLAGIAHRRPELWMDLALSYRDAQLLGQAVGLAGTAAERTELKAVDVSDAVGGVHRHDAASVGDASRLEQPTSRGRRLLSTTWLGWGVAAAITLALLPSAVWPGSGRGGLGAGRLGAGGGATQAAGLGSSFDALAAYFEKGKQEGRVVGEVPAKVILEAQPNTDGTYSVTYARQILERAVVPHFYRASMNELGQVGEVRVRDVHEGMMPTRGTGRAPGKAVKAPA